MLPPFTASYDAKGDVLYLSGSDNRPAAAREIAPGVLLRFANDNGDLVGVTLIDASRLNRMVCGNPVK